VATFYSRRGIFGGSVLPTSYPVRSAFLATVTLLVFSSKRVFTARKLTVRHRQPALNDRRRKGTRERGERSVHPPPREESNLTAVVAKTTVFPSVQHSQPFPLYLPSQPLRSRLLTVVGFFDTATTTYPVLTWLDQR